MEQDDQSSHSPCWSRWSRWGAGGWSPGPKAAHARLAMADSRVHSNALGQSTTPQDEEQGGPVPVWGVMRQSVMWEPRGSHRASRRGHGRVREGGEGRAGAGSRGSNAGRGEDRTEAPEGRGEPPSLRPGLAPGGQVPWGPPVLPGLRGGEGTSRRTTREDGLDVCGRCSCCLRPQAEQGTGRHRTGMGLPPARDGRGSGQMSTFP